MSQSRDQYEQLRLENDSVVLEIFDPVLHAAQYVKEQLNSDFLKYTPSPTYQTTDEFTRDFVQEFGPTSDECFYAVIDKTTNANEANPDYNYAGVVAFSSKGYKNATIELGAMIFPAFHGTHIAANAIGLLLLWALDPPSLGGLGLRRVEWKAHAQNAASGRFAEKMGFVLEGIARWERLFPRGVLSLSVEALERRNGKKEESAGRHTAIYSLVWDEWDEKRPAVITQMERRRPALT